MGNRSRRLLKTKHAADGRSEPVLLRARQPGDHLETTSLSPAGRWLLFILHAEPTLLALDGSWNVQQERTLDMEWEVSWLRFSPDGRWIAYASRNEEPAEIRVRRFYDDGSLGPEVQVATDAQWPMWSKARFSDGRLGLRYLTGNELTEVFVGPDGTVSSPRRIGSVDPIWGEGDLLADGRYVGVRSFDLEEAGPAQINIVFNWFDELKSRVDTAR